MQPLHDDINACAALVQKGDPDRFMAIMAAPVEARAKLFPLFAFNIEVSRAPWVSKEPMIAEMRLQWWLDAMDEIATGATVRRHEVVTPLAAHLSPEQALLFKDLISARRWDVYKDPFDSEAAFETYLSHTTGNLLVVATQLLGNAPEPVVRDFAAAHAVTRWLLAIPELEAAERIPLLDGRPEAVRVLAETALDRQASGRKRWGEIEPAVRAALYCCWKDRAILRQATKTPDRVAAGALGLSGFREKFGLLTLTLTGRL